MGPLAIGLVHDECWCIMKQPHMISGVYGCERLADRRRSIERCGLAQIL
jgi:hypothetical protein